MDKLLKIIIRIALMSALVLSMVPGILSCADLHIESMDKIIVQVWQNDSLVSNGIIVGNGSEALPILEYYDSISDDLYVVYGQNKY